MCVQEDVDKFMQAPENTSAEQVLRRLDEEHTKYKFMESNLIEKKRRQSVLSIPYKEIYYYTRLRNRIPDLKKTLDMIKFLKSMQVCPVMKTGLVLLTTPNTGL